MTKDAKIPKTPTVGGVWSTEEMDSAINDLTFKYASLSTVLDEIQSAIVGGGNHSNREGNERGNPRFRTNYEGFFDNHKCGHSPKQVLRHDNIGSLDEEGEENHEVFDGGLRGGNRGPKVVTRRNDNRRGYGE